MLATTWTWLNPDGTPLAGGTVETYDAGTNTPKISYSEYTLTTPNTNPVVLDSNGQADIWISGMYKFIVKDANGVVVGTRDNMYGPGGSQINFVDGTVGPWKTKIAAYDFMNGDNLLCKGTWSGDLPASPLAGHWVRIKNYGVGVITVGRNGNPINSLTDDIEIQLGEHWLFVFADSSVDASTGWVAFKIAKIDGTGSSGEENPYSVVTGLTNAATAQTRYLINSTSSSGKVQLPSAPANGTWVVVGHSGSNSGDVEPSGIDTIEGGSTFDIPIGAEFKFVYLSGDWKIMSS